MKTKDEFEIFLSAVPGLEPTLYSQMRPLRFRALKLVDGGVLIRGNWPDVWRANLEVRGANRIIARLATFRVVELANLEKRAREIAWSDVLRPEIPFHVEAACAKSKIYHSGAAAERVARAVSTKLGAPLSEDADVVIKVRIDHDMCTIGIDTSGEPLHKRGHKAQVNKAPMRETLASLFLHACGFTGVEPLIDPMCGSGTFVIEAAEIAIGLKPGRTRKFAFEQLATFDAAGWRRLRDAAQTRDTSLRFFGSDRDVGAATISAANAQRAGVAAITAFRQQAIADLSAPPGQPGLIVVNPPYGTRIGDRQRLVPLYRTLGQILLTRFPGWRVGLVTTDAMLAKATGLPFARTLGPVAHGGLRVTLHQTEPLP